ncbi:hypothetical protein Tco_0828663 [Tanacetum coccineum]
MSSAQGRRKGDDVLSGSEDRTLSREMMNSVPAIFEVWEMARKVPERIGSYKEYELNNPVTRDLKEPWLDNGVPYQLSTWDGSVENMTTFQDHKWYDELADGILKEETLMHKAKVEESWGNATPGLMKFCAWLINSFGNFHELDYNVLVKLQECCWKINAHEVAPL